MRPPSSASSRFIRAWIALSAEMSSRPRARPDWLVAITVCQPAWLSRAIASSEPGIGTHSAGDLTKSSRSSLIVPSRSRMTSFTTRLLDGETRQVGDAVHRRPQRGQQGEAVGAQGCGVDVDHDVVEKGIHRRLEAGEEAERPSVLALGVGPVGARADVAEGGG